MSNEKKILLKVLENNQIPVNDKRMKLLEEFLLDQTYINAIAQINTNQNMLISEWELKNRIADILQQQIYVPNGTVYKQYEAKIDFFKLGWVDIVFSDFAGLENTGLLYDNDSETIIGNPTVSGDLKVTFKFRIKGEKEDSKLNEKIITIVLNPDPKSLWKNIESDKNGLYWKEENDCKYGKLGDRNIVVASKRGRSHANVGGYREDDFAYDFLEQSGWSIIAVADGAGSSSLARKASEIACNSIIEFAKDHFSEIVSSDFDEIISSFNTEISDDVQKRLSHVVYSTLSKAALWAHQKVLEAAVTAGVSNKDFYSTLIFTFIKKYEFGYAFLSFGVGDCPIAVINKEETEITLLNWLDVGEFGGGTRFITMPEIFTSEKFSTRFKFKLVQDFSYLFLMTDGIYDPKFIVESNLEKIENWKLFIDDLKGNNEDCKSVEFKSENTEIANQLSEWMDFWSPGNHDDRTLAIIF